MVKNGNELLMNHYGYSGRPTQDKKIKIQLKLGLIKKTEKNVLRNYTNHQFSYSSRCCCYYQFSVK